ncbi:hypothetical protein XA68_10467 [Ophiocordyceps unilateralis]|uniref:Kinesin-like protein n=1 Tax=Ophiocordyceps unilateralis TaxID=268505 RepID=A0A2A9P2Q8_OPHUN|nr:hypothetical protein XA68_10467 [Ophiocordyceps unilateralis]
MTALPRPARPSQPTSTKPPNKALPPLPVAKTRKSTAADAAKPASTTANRPASNNTLRRTNSSLSASLAASSQPKALAAAINANGRTLRKSVSINSFPQPPRRQVRTASMPPSPLRSERPRSRKPKSPKSLSRVSYASSTPSLLNGSGEGKSVNTARMSDGLMSISSPPQSRSSSAQDSYSTSATTYEDSPEAAAAAAAAAAASKSDRSSALSTSDRRCSKSETKGNVLVSVRVRPDAQADAQGLDPEWVVDGRKSLIAYKGKEGGEYLYDNVFATHDNNGRVYDHIAKRLVRRVMEGYHGTVFAYGMTGTGKTFSMQGTASSPGVIPLAITDIFSYIRETPSREFLLRVSYLEIYNEKIHDLLNMPAGNGATQQDEIKLREDSKRGVYATPLKEEIVQSPTQLLRVIARGDQARRTASTQFNARSSRSHAVVQIVVESRERIPAGGTAGGLAKRSGLLPGGVRISTLSLIDLAGSEKAAESKERRQEGAHINKSLLTLGTVIAKLSEWNDKEGGKGNDKESKHLPYRDSKLTRLLQGALSGDSLVSILCTIQMGAAGSPAASGSNHTSETLNTLKFASRAKNSIVSHAKRAEEALGVGGDGGARVLLERYRVEISELRQQLDEQTRKKAVPGPQQEEKLEKVLELEATERHEEQMLEMQLARTALKERIDHLNRLILSSKSIGVNSNGSMSSLGQYARFSQLSMSGSIRSSIATSTGARPLVERTSSMTSASSTIGRRSSGGVRMAIDGSGGDGEEDDCVGELGDGTASMATQNRALRADLADKNRYIATLEKRLLHARRASSSRTSVGISAPSMSIMVGEDHSVAAALKEKDAEIAELRARLDDKDRMLAALRSATRTRDSASASSETRPPQSPGESGTPTPTLLQKRRTQSTDEMNRMLEEMIQDGVDTGHILRSDRGSVRLQKLGSLTEPACGMQPLRSPTPMATESL